MITLQDDALEITVQGETEDKAIRAMKTARTKAKEAKQQRERDRETARVRARLCGWHAYHLKHSRGGQPWTIKPAKFCRQRTDDILGVVVRLSTADGDSEFSLNYGTCLLAIVWNMGGYDALVFLQYKDEAPECYAVGVCNGEWCLEQMPGIALADYRKDEVQA